MKPHKINQLAVWIPMHSEGLLSKVFVDYPYTSKGIIAKSTASKPIVRYAKNYQLDKRRFSLCLISLEKDTTKIEKWLDEQAKNIKDDQLKSRFTLLDVEYKE